MSGALHRITHRELFGDDGLAIVARRMEITRPLGPCSYDCVTLSLVQSGSYAKVMPGRTVHLRPGKLVIRDHSVDVAYLPREESTALVVHLGRRMLSRDLRWLVARPLARSLLATFGTRRSPGLLVLDVEPELRRRMAATIEGLIDIGPDTRTLARIARLLDLLDGIEEALSGETVDPVQPAFARPRATWPPALAHAVRVMEADPAANWTMERLSREVHITSRQLFRLFEHTGRTPRQYLTELRLRHVAVLLDTTTMSFTRAARTAGWTNAHHARALFVSHFGLEPDEYRHRP